MIIARTPFRISFFGGGTDYPAWYRQHGGAVLASTIDKYCYITCRYLPPFHEHRFSIVYSRMEQCDRVDEIKHPAVREVLRYLKTDRGMEIHTDADLPGRSGMGSSSAFTVGLLHAVHALQGRMVGKYQLAMESIHLEQEVLKEAVGSQDQVSAAYGGLNHIVFLPNGEISVQPVTISLERMSELNGRLLMFYTGIMRTASQVAGTYTGDMNSRTRQLESLRELVEEGLTILNSEQDIKRFGELLHQAWQVKRSLSAVVSNPEVDGLYNRAREAGAIGGKLTGAGGGGFLLLFAEPEKHAEIRAALDDLIWVPLALDFSGSQIIYYAPEQDYRDVEVSRTSRKIKPFREFEAPDATRAVTTSRPLS